MVPPLDAIDPRLPQPVGRAVHAFLTPERAVATEAERPLLNQADARRLTGEGQDLAVWHWRPPASAEGAPAVLLVHGWNSRGSHLGAFVPPLLAAGFGVWAFDAHAHGDSGGGTSSVVHHARSVHLVAQAAGDIAAVIAHSVGSPATLLAVGWGLSLRASVHLAGPAALRRVALAAAHAGGLEPAHTPAYLAAIERLAGLPLDDVQPPALTAALRHRGLLWHDPADREIPFAESEELARHWPGAELRRAPGLGHRRLLRDPAVIAASIAFLEAHTTQRTATAAEAPPAG